VHYDIGLFYFVTERYNEAFHHLSQASVLFNNVDPSACE